LKKIVKLAETPQDWDAQALYDKAELYAERMFRNGTDDPEKVLWSALALELLARAALSNISPVLLADTRKDGNLDHAVGLPVKAERFRPSSIGVEQVFERLNRAVPDFIEQHKEFCVKHTGHRNAELHSGQAPFDDIKNWEGAYYQGVEVLLKSMGLVLEDFIGEENVESAKKQMAAHADKRAEAVKKDIENSRKAWEALDAAEREKRVAEATAWATRQAGHRVKCPSCGSPALVVGEPTGAPERSINDELITETQTMMPHRFECVACGLKIAGLARLNVAGLGDKYKKTQSFDAYEFFRQDEPWEGYEDDNNERF
jgi:hypothetical protein